MNEPPRGVREILLGMIDAEADYRWRNATASDDREARRAYDGTVELRGFVAALADDDPDALVLDAVASDVFSGQELPGLLALHSRTLHAEPRLFVSALTALATSKAVDRLLTKF